MSRLSIFIVPLMLAAVTFISCKKNDTQPAIKAPATYAFTRNGSSTVSFGGQTTRIQMATQLVAGLKVNANSAAQLQAMFAHKKDGQDFTGANATTLNASDKQIKNKVADSDPFKVQTVIQAQIRQQFDGFITAQAGIVFPAWGNTAAKGTPGYLQEDGGGKKRYVNANGLELDQAFGKSLIGALMVDQTLNNYLTPLKLDGGAGNPNRAKNKNHTPYKTGNYTDMEHFWDEGYGYVFGGATNTADPLPVSGGDPFLYKYIGRVDGDKDFKGIAQAIFDAFKSGRAAIVANNYAVRDAQAKIISQKISEVIAVRAIYYLQAGKTELAKTTPDRAKAFHDLSEAYGFVASLMFTRNASGKPFFTPLEVGGFTSKIYPVSPVVSGGKGFWDVTTVALDEVSTAIAAKFDNITVPKAASTN